MKIIITGSAGYIGSCLYEYFKDFKQFKVLGIDKVYPKLKKQKLFKKVDLTSYSSAKKIFHKFGPDVVIHLAGESTIDNIKKIKNYLKNNITVTKNLIKIVNKQNTGNFIFSSTAAVYANKALNLIENSKLKPNNIYGVTKLKCENYIQQNLNKEKKFIILRFFNVCSSLFEHKIGEFHIPETHFIPIVIQKILDKKNIIIYGRNYKTKDGSAIRDYVHVKDILRAILLSINYLKSRVGTSQIINIGSKKGFSNIEIIKSLEKFFKKKVKFMFTQRRYGDLDKLVCDNRRAKKILNWKPNNSKLKLIIKDEFNWQNYLRHKKILKKSIY